MMNILVHLLMTIYSGLHLPCAIGVLFLTLTDKTKVYNYSWNYNVATISMMVSAGLSIIMIMIPYISSLSISQIFHTLSTLSLIWYHLVIIASTIFNTGALVSFYFYISYLSEVPPAADVVTP